MERRTYDWRTCKDYSTFEEGFMVYNAKPWKPSLCMSKSDFDWCDIDAV